MLDVLALNSSVTNKDVRLFDMSKVYIPTTADCLPDEPARLTLGFITTDAKNGFYKMKGYIEAILNIAGIEDAKFVSCDTEPTFHPGRCAKFYAGDNELGIFGEAHPAVADNYGVAAKIYLAELFTDALFDCRLAEISYTPIPKHPAIERDFSFVCAESIEAASVSTVIRAASRLVSSVELFDIYRGPQIARTRRVCPMP